MTYGTTPGGPIPPVAPDPDLGASSPSRSRPEDREEFEDRPDLGDRRSAVELSDPDDPVAIEAEIARTRESLRSGVDALQDKVLPSRVVGRRVERARETARGFTEKVMGSDDDGDAGVRGAASSARDAVVGGVSDAADATGRLPDAARRKTQGNPLAAGTIAFGLGWLVASLIPTAEKEREVGRKIADKVDTDAIADTVSEKVEEAKQTVGQKAADSLRSAADTAEEKAGTSSSLR